MQIRILYFIMVLLIVTSCQKDEISLGTDVHEFFHLQEKGISMPIQLHGNVASNKIVLIVHGGPGGNSLAYRDNYVTKNVEKEFAIAYWDQRLAGNSQGNSTNSDIVLYKNDLKKVVQLLQYRYGSDKKIFVMAHSWGGFITPYFLEENNNQAIVKGWIQVGGIHNFYMGDSLTKETLLQFGNQEIALNKNVAKWQEITNYCNAHSFNESTAVGDQLNIYAGVGEGLLDYWQRSAVVPFIQGVTANYVSVSSYIINNMITKSKKINIQAYNLAVSESLYKIKTPTLLLWGKYDIVCPVGLATDIKNKIGSADVTEIILQKSAHSPMFNEQKEFWDALTIWLKVH